MNIKHGINVSDYQSMARNILDHDVWNYIEGGVEDEKTLQENVGSFGKYKLIPRILNDVKERNTSVNVLGSDLSFPVILAPTSPLRLINVEAEFAPVRAAYNTGTLAVVSMDSHYPMAEIVKQSQSDVWFQLYSYGDMDFIETTIQNVIKSGYKTLLVTVDAFYVPRRERLMRSKFKMPEYVKLGNIDQRIKEKYAREDNSIKRFALTWSDIEKIVELSSIPVVLKGVLNEADIIRAKEFGIRGVVLSNHGGRQLDDSLMAVDVLSALNDSIKNSIEIFIDGGIRRGSDVVKALALGAKAVLIGRPYLYGYAVNGQQGIENVLSILRSEIDTTLAQIGIKDIRNINRTSIRTL